MEELASHLASVRFLGRTADEVGALLVDAVAEFGARRGWRVYRRARSVVPLPPPYENRFSTVDVAFARPDGSPVVVEVDRTDRQRTLDKLHAEAAAGRVAVWVRWGTNIRIKGETGPVRVVRVPVLASRSPDGPRFDRVPTIERPPPGHSPAP